MQAIAVPVKSLEGSKSRLSPVLSPAERAVLTMAMVEDVLDACMAQSGWEVLVISRSEAVREVSIRRGANVIGERGASLQEAVRQAEDCVPGRWSRLAVVLADLPLLTAEALRAALERGSGATIVAAPAASDGGTNLLLRRPPRVMPARFGRSSFVRHRAEARRRGLRFVEVRRAELGFDLDRPSDLVRFLSVARRGRTLAACREMGLPARLSVSA